MRFERMKQRLCAVPPIAAWPQMIDLIERAVHRESRSVWEYPVLACQAVGGSAEIALPGAAAVFCSIASIHLVDDMLDEDPSGDYRTLGAGAVANLALAFQAAAHRMLDEAAVEAETRALLQASLARMSLATAFGQNLDAGELGSEEEYWAVVDAKTPPLFASAFAIGALLGGAPVEVATQMEHLGYILGRFVQVSDDLADAMQSPASADWRRRTNNLPILFAMTADHADREQFVQLSTRADMPAALAAAQRVLIKSGAVSYCVFHLLELSHQARELLAEIPLEDHEPIARLLAAQMKPLERLFTMAATAPPSKSPPS